MKNAEVIFKVNKEMETFLTQNKTILVNVILTVNRNLRNKKKVEKPKKREEGKLAI
jgi:hypothetical protein